MRRIRLGFLSVAAIALILSTLQVEAKTPAAHDKLKGFVPSGRFGFFKDGKHVRRARVLHSKQASAYLMVNTGIQSALMIRTRESAKALEAVPLEDIIPREDGSRDLKRSARIKPVGKFFAKAGGIQLEGEGLTASLRPKPPLVGWQREAQLREHKPEYGRDAAQANVNLEKIKALKARKSPITVKVYFGSWCTECDALLPYILHLDNALSSAKNIQFHYYAVPTREGFKADPEIVKHKISSLPTGIVYVKNKEANRVIQAEWRTPAFQVDAIVGTAEMQANTPPK